MPQYCLYQAVFCDPMNLCGPVNHSLPLMLLIKSFH